MTWIDYPRFMNGDRVFSELRKEEAVVLIVRFVTYIFTLTESFCLEKPGIQGPQ